MLCFVCVECKGAAYHCTPLHWCLWCAQWSYWLWGGPFGWHISLYEQGILYTINCDWTVVIAVIYDYCVCITREVIAVYTYPHAFSYDGGYQLSKAWLHLLTTPNPCVHERPLNNSSVASVNATHYSLLLRGNIVTFLDKFHCVYLIHMNKSNSHSIWF